MPAAKKATSRPKRRVISPAEKRTQLRLTVDSKFTKSHFNQLFAVLKIRRKNALAEHIIMSFKSKAAQAQLVAFYNNQWLNIPFQSIDTAFVFPLTFEIADELERVGGEVLGGVNRSKAFCLMVVYFSFVHKLKKWGGCLSTVTTIGCGTRSINPVKPRIVAARTTVPRKEG